MGKRHDSIGIKQVIQYEWLQRTANLLLAGLDAKTIRHELHEFLSDRRGKSSESERSDWTRTFTVNNLMSIWVSPQPEVIPFRDASLALLMEKPSMSLPIHWGMISAAYPFWFNVARQTGRLLALQSRVTQAQIVGRLKEQYGDRQTVFRYGRYVLRSFVAWGILQDSATSGVYKKKDTLIDADIDIAIMLIESALLATPEARGALGLLLNSPALFPFQLPLIFGDIIPQYNNRIEVNRYNLNDELLKLVDNLPT